MAQKCRFPQEDDKAILIRRAAGMLLKMMYAFCKSLLFCFSPVLSWTPPPIPIPS